jgi:Xaa-Pro aminopeptidase
MEYSRRRRKLNEAIAERKLDALVVTHLPNIRYLIGFTGSAGVLVATDGRLVFFTDGRYTSQAKDEVQGARVVIAKGPALTAATDYLKQSSQDRRRIGIEAEHMPVSQRSAISRLLPKGARLVETVGLVQNLRTVKDDDEIERIRKAVNLGAELLPAALKAIKPGVPETAVAAELEYAARTHGAEAMSFDTIVASGTRSALPHGKASAAPIARKGFVVLDFGVILAGYCSDMTRTVHVGRASREARRMYDAVLEAQLAAIAAVRAGVSVADVDRAARSVLENSGLGKFFTHSTGHGVGLEIHEPPRIAKGGTEVLQPGMVITIEPGAYIAGEGGVRIEDMVVVTDSGCDVLTPASKDWTEI